MTTKCSIWFWTVSFYYKEHFGDNEQNLGGIYGLDSSSALVLIYQFW